MPERKSEEIRRREILEAALRCFSKKGYHETTMDDIAAESGLTKGGIYWYFEGKKEIFIAVIEQMLQDDKFFWKDLLKDYEIGPDFLVTAGVLYLKRCLENSYKPSFFAEFVAESYRDETIRERLDKFYKQWRKMIREAFDYAIQKGKIKRIDSEAISSIIIALVDGLVTQCWKKIDYERIWITFSKALLEGIQKEEEDR